MTLTASLAEAIRCSLASFVSVTVFVRAVLYELQDLAPQAGPKSIFHPRGRTADQNPSRDCDDQHGDLRAFVMVTEKLWASSSRKAACGSRGNARVRGGRFGR